MEKIIDDLVGFAHIWGYRWFNELTDKDADDKTFNTMMSRDTEGIHAQVEEWSVDEIETDFDAEFFTTLYNAKQNGQEFAEGA